MIYVLNIWPGNLHIPQQQHSLQLLHRHDPLTTRPYMHQQVSTCAWATDLVSPIIIWRPRPTDRHASTNSIVCYLVTRRLRVGFCLLRPQSCALSHKRRRFLGAELSGFVCFDESMGGRHLSSLKDGVKCQRRRAPLAHTPRSMFLTRASHVCGLLEMLRKRRSLMRAIKR